jgi:SAM-dependent methyltransferase
VHKEFEEILSTLNKTIIHLDAKGVQKEFENIPLDIFGRIQIDRPSEYPNIFHWLPQMPSSDIQRSWTGSADHVLMKQSLAFLKTIISAYHAIACKPLGLGNVLDFGCGWGRLIRLLYKYVPADRIYGVDPWLKSIEICQETNVRANLFLSEYVPRSLPTPENLKFDFIMAFSVFTHLSEKVTKICAETLRNYLTDTGVVAITIRPVEYWDFMRNGKESSFTREDIIKLLTDHDQKGFAFYPHNREKIEGEVTYGDTSMSLEFVRDNFVGLDIVGVEFNESDPLQLIVFLKKSAK